MDLPPIGFFECNFDGASKNNPDLARFGRVFRDLRGRVKINFYVYMGVNCTNTAELMACITGIQIYKCWNFFPLIMEGDSKLIISLTTRIQNNTHASKLAQG